LSLTPAQFLPSGRGRLGGNLGKNSAPDRARGFGMEQIGTTVSLS
jgi:hypothetical protein